MMTTNMEYDLETGKLFNKPVSTCKSPNKLYRRHFNSKWERKTQILLQKLDLTWTNMIRHQSRSSKNLESLNPKQATSLHVKKVSRMYNSSALLG